jgi:hypothetical protein
MSTDRHLGGMRQSMLRIMVCTGAILGLGAAVGCGNEERDDGGDTAGDTDAASTAATSASAGSASNDGEDGDDGDDGGTVDNVAACDELIESLECGGADFGQYVSCSSYASLSCSLVDYFECLSDNFACSDGVFDPSGWTSCASLAMCS